MKDYKNLTDKEKTKLVKKIVHGANKEQARVMAEAHTTTKEKCFNCGDLKEKHKTNPVVFCDVEDCGCEGFLPQVAEKQECEHECHNKTGFAYNYLGSYCSHCKPQVAGDWSEEFAKYLKNDFYTGYCKNIIKLYDSYYKHEKPDSYGGNVPWEAANDFIDNMRKAILDKFSKTLLQQQQRIIEEIESKLPPVKSINPTQWSELDEREKGKMEAYNTMHLFLKQGKEGEK